MYTWYAYINGRTYINIFYRYVEYVLLYLKNFYPNVLIYVYCRRQVLLCVEYLLGKVIYVRQAFSCNIYIYNLQYYTHYVDAYLRLYKIIWTQFIYLYFIVLRFLLMLPFLSNIHRDSCYLHKNRNDNVYTLYEPFLYKIGMHITYIIYNTNEGI